MKILVLGADGQVGWELQRSLAPLGELIIADRMEPYTIVDFCDPDVLRALVKECQPQWIVNAAAYTAVDKAQDESDLARKINAEAPTALAMVAREVGAKLVHFSTDYVFDGSGSDYRDETADPSPLSVYGRTKLEGELGIANALSHHLILRTSWVYAARGHNFVRTILRLAKERCELRVVDDQIGAPTGAELLADVTAHCLMQLESGRGRWGLFHCVAEGETSWFGLARHVLAQARSRGVEFALLEEGLKPVTTANYSTAAQRPLNSRLSTRLLQRTFGLRLPDWQFGVNRMLHELEL